MSTVAVLAGALGGELSLRAQKQGKTAAKQRAVATGRRATPATVARRVSEPNMSRGKTQTRQPRLRELPAAMQFGQFDDYGRSEYSECTMSPAKSDVVRQFVEAWGAMGSLWGINRSVARVHALLMANEEPLSLDAIAEQLQMSKGNASMSLRELRTFGVVRQVEVPGDRRDFYVTEPDVWTMFFRIIRERKRREFDPALEAIHRLVDAPGATGAVRGRLEQMADLLTTVEGVVNRFLANPESARAALAFIGGMPFGSEKKK
jgi:HTH-type transcriptional regulator, glycine betaine synthesis regulator